MLSLPSRGTNEEIIFNSLLFPHDSGHSFLSLFFFFFPCPSNPSSLSGFIKSFQISEEDFIPNDAKNFNVALDNGKPLFNYHWKLPPLSENLVFGSF